MFTIQHQKETWENETAEQQKIIWITPETFEYVETDELKKELSEKCEEFWTRQKKTVT